ncbi:thioredoxin family protein [Aliiroseovarius sp.]|uniref:thioredoxin family protein n=1 Tax=Aliiroseovarius sp. TaxID=1872442 RepID=UPI003BACD509
MKRRTFLTLATGATLAPLAARAAVMDYTPGLVQQALDNGETVFLDFKASWCSTCAAQERVINALRAEDPTYDGAITFINVDWDAHGNGALAQSLNIPRRSTLVVLKGNQELGRIVAGTRKSDIKALMDTALAAATA